MLRTVVIRSRTNININSAVVNAIYRHTSGITRTIARTVVGKIPRTIAEAIELAVMVRGNPEHIAGKVKARGANLSDGWDDVEAVPVVRLLKRLDRNVTELQTHEPDTAVWKESRQGGRVSVS